MKILQVSSHFSPNLGGVETHLDDLLQALSVRNNKVFVLTFSPLISKVTWKLYEQKKNIEVFRIPWIPGLFYKLKNNPILEFFYLVPPLFLILPLVLLYFRPTVIQAHGLLASFPAVFWGKVFGKRVVTTTHSIYIFPKSGFYRSFSKWIFQNSDIVLTLSKGSKKEIESLGVDQSKVKVFTYWVDIQKFDVSSAKQTAKKVIGIYNQFTVLFVGRLVKEKGLRILLKSFRKWRKDITLVIAGDGPLKPEVEKAKNNNLVFCGRVNQNELPKYYNAADLTIVPSTSEEGFGRVLIESLASGTPVLAANRGGITEAIDNTVGKLIDITPQNITISIEYFYKNPDRLGKLSKNARKFAINRYSERNVETIIKAYTK